MTMSNYQGKRPDQVKSSEQIAFWAIALFIITIIILKLTQ